MKNIMKKIHPWLFLLSLSTLYSCTTFTEKNHLVDNMVNVEIINSTHAEIKYVTVKSSGSGTLVYGKVQRPQGVHGRIRGHLDVQVFAPDGTSIYKDSLRYKRSIILPRRTRFSFEVADALSEGSSIHIRPHYTVHDDTCKKKKSTCHFE